MTKHNWIKLPYGDKDWVHEECSRCRLTRCQWQDETLEERAKYGMAWIYGTSGWRSRTDRDTFVDPGCNTWIMRKALK